MRRPSSALLAGVLVPGALVVSGIGAAPAHAATPSPAPSHHAFARPHRAGAAVPPTTPSSTIDAVVPLHWTASARAEVARLVHERATASQRRAALRRLVPDAAHQQAVSRWAAQHGFQVTGVTPLGVTIRGRADRVAAAFGTSLRSATQQGKRFVLPRTAPVVPGSLRGLADPVVGLDTRPLFHSHTVYGGGDVQAMTSTAVRGRTAGSGATVATVNLSGWHPGDLTTYRQAAFGPSDVAPTVTPVVVGQGHAAATPLEDDYGMQTEVALDAEAIAGVAPAANQRQYFGGNSSADYVGILQRMATDLTTSPGLFQTASTSWGTCEAAIDASTAGAMRTAITAIRAAGATFFASSGDAGGTDCSGQPTPGDPSAVDFPASAEDSVAVGGTSVSGSAPSYASTAWSGSGGGCSTLVPAPARQASTGSPCSGRAVPDIAGLADPATGYWVFDRMDGWVPVGGTSLAAPSSAAGLADLMAHAGLTTLTSTSFLDLAYQNPAAFTDVTSGNNGVYRAGTGFDLVTGLGVPRWTALEAAVTGNPAPVVTTTNEPMLVADPTSDATTAALEVQVGSSAFETSLVPNGEPVTGYSVSTAPTDCSSPSLTPPTSVPLGSAAQGTTQLSVSVATSDAAVPGGCITVQRPVVVDTIKPVVPVPVASYVGTTTPAYRFSWATATDTGGTGVFIYAVWVTDVTTHTDVASFYTAGRAFPYASSAPFKAVAGHQYVVEVDAIDEAINLGYRTTAFVAPYDDTKASLSRHLVSGKYVSDWARTSSSADYLGSNVSSNRTGALFAFAFKGKTLTAGVVKGRYGGYADIYVDNVRKARVSLYSATTAYRQAIRLATFSAIGTHQVVVKVVGAHVTASRGNYVYLDSLTVGV